MTSEEEGERQLILWLKSLSIPSYGACALYIHRVTSSVITKFWAFEGQIRAVLITTTDVRRSPHLSGTGWWKKILNSFSNWSRKAASVRQRQQTRHITRFVFGALKRSLISPSTALIFTILSLCCSSCRSLSSSRRCSARRACLSSSSSFRLSSSATDIWLSWVRKRASLLRRTGVCFIKHMCIDHQEMT